MKRDNKYIAPFKALGRRHLIPFNSLLLLLLNTSHSVSAGRRAITTTYEKFFPGRYDIITDAMRVKNTFFLYRVIGGGYGSYC